MVAGAREGSSASQSSRGRNRGRASASAGGSNAGPTLDVRDSGADTGATRTGGRAGFPSLRLPGSGASAAESGAGTSSRGRGGGGSGGANGGSTSRAGAGGARRTGQRSAGRPRRSGNRRTQNREDNLKLVALLAAVFFAGLVLGTIIRTPESGSGLLENSIHLLSDKQETEAPSSAQRTLPPAAGWDLPEHSHKADGKGSDPLSLTPEQIESLVPGAQKDRTSNTSGMGDRLETLASDAMDRDAGLAMPRVVPASATGRGVRPRLAIVIDDLGRSEEALNRVRALPAPLTLAFLPYEEEDVLAAQLDSLRGTGHEIIAHVPMQPEGASGIGPLGLRLTDNRPALRDKLQRVLEKVPGAVGINNHMGSRLTASWPHMTLVMEILQERGLYFLDSRTTVNTVALQSARRAQVPSMERDVFLDNDQAYEAIRGQLEKAAALAKEKGHAVAIGHPHKLTLAVLREWLPKLDARGIVLAPVSDLVTIEPSRIAQLPED